MPDIILFVHSDPTLVLHTSIPLIFITGSLDCTIKLWDFAIITDETITEENGTNSNVQKEEKFLLRSFATKNSPIKNLHFTRRNLLLAVGSYEGSS